MEDGQVETKIVQIDIERYTGDILCLRDALLRLEEVLAHLEIEEKPVLCRLTPEERRCLQRERGGLAPPYQLSCSGLLAGGTLSRGFVSVAMPPKPLCVPAHSLADGARALLPYIRRPDNYLLHRRASEIASHAQRKGEPFTWVSAYLKLAHLGETPHRVEVIGAPEARCRLTAC